MTLSKRILMKWRKEALVKIEECAEAEIPGGLTADRVLQLTQELLDIQLLKEAKEENA